MKKKKQVGPHTAPPSLMNKDECGAAMDTDLFMKRWILLMKSGEVKTLKQNYLVFLFDPADPPECSWHHPSRSPLFYIFLSRYPTTRPSSRPLSTSLTFHRLMEMRPFLSALTVSLNPLF
jgi:hypothetical protein